MQLVVINEFSWAFFLLSCIRLHAMAHTIELRIHLGGLLSTQEARVALAYHLGVTLTLLSCLATSQVHP